MYCDIACRLYGRGPKKLLWHVVWVSAFFSILKCLFVYLLGSFIIFYIFLTVIISKFKIITAKFDFQKKIDRYFLNILNPLFF